VAAEAGWRQHGCDGDWRVFVTVTDLYINKLDAGLATLSIAKGDPFKLISAAQHALCG